MFSKEYSLVVCSLGLVYVILAAVSLSYGNVLLTIFIVDT